MRRNRSGAGGFDCVAAHEQSRQRRTAASAVARKMDAPLWERVKSLLRRHRSVLVAAHCLPVSAQSIYRHLRDDMQAHYGRRKKRRREEPHAFLRFGVGWYKRPKGSGKVAMADARPLRARPAAVLARRRIGDGEADTLCFVSCSSPVLVLVERKTLLTRLALLPDKKAERTAAAAARLLRDVPARTVTSDRGREFARWRAVERALGLRWYVCDPSRPTQRPLVENANGLLRMLLPRDLPASALTQAKVREAENFLNRRPRPSMNYQTSNHMFFA